MTRVTIVIREPGKLRPDYSLVFELPEIPRVGSYLSICRPDNPEPFGEDMIVRQIWWRLSTSVTSSFVSKDDLRIGRPIEIFVECEPALGPYSSDAWRRTMEVAKNRGIEIEKFDVARFSVREKDIEP
jgi:hypothetical protein